MCLEALLNFTAYTLHNQIFSPLTELVVLDHEFFKDRAFRHILFNLALRVRQGSDSFSPCTKGCLSVDLGPKLEEELGTGE